MKIRYFLLAFLVLTIAAKAQLNVQPLTDSSAVKLLVQKFLLDSGAEVSNIKYKGTFPSSGSFGACSRINLNEGILLTTGSATIAIGPNNSTNAASVFNTLATDSDLSKLLALPNSKLFDEVILEFDLIVKSDTLTFHYVFASEEYPEYVCGSQNDGFGIFISGVNPAGANYINKNIALVPGTITPVNIGTINPGVKGTSTLPNEFCTPDGLKHGDLYVDNYGDKSLQ